MLSRNRLQFLVLACLGVMLACAPASVAEQPDVVAKIGDSTVSKAELMEKAASQLAQIRQQEYDILNQTLTELIDTRLIEAAAEAEGKTAEEYLKAHVEAKAAAPTDAEVQAFYDENKARLGGQTFEQSKGRIAQYLKQLRSQEFYTAKIKELRDANKVVVLLDPPRLTVSADDDPTMGPDSAPVKIITFTDYECPYCSRAEGTVKQVVESYGDKVQIVLRDFPLSFHRNAQKAAEAAGCAHEQGKFWAMHDKLFENQRALTVDKLGEYAQQLELDVDKFNSCLSSDSRAEEVRSDLADGQSVGVSGTPAFFVNGRMLSGALPFEEFAKVIDEELARTN